MASSALKLLKAWNLKPNKSLGQNFFINSNLSKAIVNASGITASDNVLEIGAGLGALTLPLAKTCSHVFAIEKDVRLANLLKTELLVAKMDNVDLITADILGLNIDELAGHFSHKLVVMGNLPYNISSQILVRLITSRAHISHAVVMFQKELALRIMEPPGSKKYGRISAMLRYCADISTVMTVTADQFYPKPQIDSMVLKIVFKEQPDFLADDEVFLFQVIKAAFGQRRKTLKNALEGSELHIRSDVASDVLKQAGIDPIRRAETLKIEEFVKLSNLLKKKIKVWD